MGERTTSAKPGRGRREDAFRAKARAHQSAFRAERLGVPARGSHGSRLGTEAALAGMNFYREWPGLLELVQRQYGIKDTPLYYDMLRSQHVPFNFFGPLALEPDGELAWSLIKWIAPDMGRVESIRIEHAPVKAKAMLGDNTAFDVFVEYVGLGGSECALGIEVKYTEKAYGYGARERARMFASDSTYHQLTAQSCLYADDAVSRLRRKDLKQLWRNHLLGSVVERAVFKSVLLYPRGNQHAARAAREYLHMLRPERQHEFVSVTFEDWLSSARQVAQRQTEVAWLEYLCDRYDVSLEPRLESLTRVPSLVLPIELSVPEGAEATYPACAAAAKLDWHAMPDRASVNDMRRLAYAIDGYQISEILGFGRCGDVANARSEEYVRSGRYLGLASDLWCCLFFAARRLHWTDYPGITEEEYKPEWDALYQALIARLRAEDGSVQRIDGTRTRWLGYGGRIETRAAWERAGVLGRAFYGGVAHPVRSSDPSWHTR